MAHRKSPPNNQRQHAQPTPVLGEGLGIHIPVVDRGYTIIANDLHDRTKHIRDVQVRRPGTSRHPAIMLIGRKFLQNSMRNMPQGAQIPTIEVIETILSDIPELNEPAPITFDTVVTRPDRKSGERYTTLVPSDKDTLLLREYRRRIYESIMMESGIPLDPKDREIDLTIAWTGPHAPSNSAINLERFFVAELRPPTDIAMGGAVFNPDPRSR